MPSAWSTLSQIRLEDIGKTYRRMFAVEEIEKHTILQWAFGAVLLFFFATFSLWIGSSNITLETAARGAEVCWPYFQDCGKLFFLQTLPLGYSQSIFYMFLYSVILTTVYAMWKRWWTLAHVLVSILLAWKLFVMFVLSYLIAGPYDYYHVALTIVLLFLPFKEFFLKLTFVVLYFLSGSTKFDETWILGTYFSTLQSGLPILPDALIPIATNIVILMQTVGAWFLLSSQKFLQRTIVAFFVFFHLYSGILVYYHYPTVSIPFLLILFGPLYRHTPIPFSRRAIIGWGFIALLFLFQLPPAWIEGDRRLTLEGNRYGMFMFEANHQCIATVKTYRETTRPITPQKEMAGRCTGQRCIASTKVYGEDGLHVREERIEIGAAWNRCDPYVEWTYLKAACKRDSSVRKIALTFDHSINGGAFYRIIDEQDVCDLAYKPFSHNKWIKLPPEAPIIGMPVKDEYRY